MKTLNAGGNPLQDRKQSVERFKTIIEPVFKTQGFVRLKGNSHMMYNKESNTLLLTTAAPSQTSMPRATKDKIRSLRKIYGNDLKCFLLYTRDYSEWKDKPIYVSTLKYILKIPNLTGVGTGIANLPTIIKSIKNGEPFWNIA